MAKEGKTERQTNERKTNGSSKGRTEGRKE